MQLSDWVARTKDFIIQFQFTHAAWDGLELTCYTESSEPFGMTEFTAGTQTRVMWNGLENDLFDNMVEPFMVNAIDLDNA